MAKSAVTVIQSKFIYTAVRVVKYKVRKSVSIKVSHVNMGSIFHVSSCNPGTYCIIKMIEQIDGRKQ